MPEAHGSGREAGGGGCSVGGSDGGVGGSSGGVVGAAAHPAAAFVELRWRPNPEPGVGFGTPPEPG